MQPDTDVTTPVCEVKLWGDKCNLDLPPANTKIMVTNVEMRLYRGQMEGNSTVKSEINVSKS